MGAPMWGTGSVFGKEFDDFIITWFNVGPPKITPSANSAKQEEIKEDPVSISSCSCGIAPQLQMQDQHRQKQLAKDYPKPSVGN
jgi:hypothetical protein